MIFVGVDLGKRGAIVGLDGQQNVVLKRPMPLIKNSYDYKSISDIFREIISQEAFVCIEKPHIMPKSGRISIASSHQCSGFIQGLLFGLGIPYEEIRAVDWQKKVLHGMNYKDTKEASILWCQKKFPSIDLAHSQRSTKPSDGIADALCIAYFSFLRNSLSQTVR